MTTSQSNDFYCAAATKLQIVVLICLLISSSGFNSWGTNKQHRLLGSCVVSKHPSCELCLFRSSCNEVLERHYSLPSQLRRRERERQGRLFYMKTPITTVSSKLPMASTDSSNDVSNDSKNLFIRLWGWFRKLLAKLWTLLKKPRQQTETKKEEVKSVDDETKSESKEVEPVQEEVVLTQMENLAAVEDETKSELTELLAAAEIETLKAPPISKKQTDIAESIIATSSRQATACPTVDLSGSWTLIVDDAFKSQYDDYLRKLGQPMLVRTVALTVIGSTKEETRQINDGQQLFIKGINVRGSWERTLEASETNVDSKTNIHAVEGHVLKPMITADDEEVEVASWWEENGTVHKSWVVGGKKYGGGDFENRRYLTDDGNILVCESIFHPNEAGRDKASVTWRFLKEGAMYGEEDKFPNPFEMFEEKTEDSPAIGDSSIVVGDIMDSVAIPDEVSKLAPRDDVEQYIDKESWVPPAGERWALAAPGVDLSGKWKLIITERFKEAYSKFLKSLGQPGIVIGAAVLLIGNTREETKQADGGRYMYIKGINAKGIWERTLVASGSDFDETMMPKSDGTYNHLQVPVVTADAEKVRSVSWWEKDGTVHVSWTLDVKKYGGGSFESRRYLENNGDVYVCESTFHPNDTERREKSTLTWRFLREGATVFIGE